MKATQSAKQKAQELIEALKKQRAEIELKMHLASLEVKDEWRLVEDKWQQLNAKGSRIEHEMGNSAHALAEELKQSYKRIRKLL